MKKPRFLNKRYADLSAGDVVLASLVVVVCSMPHLILCLQILSGPQIFSIGIDSLVAIVIFLIFSSEIVLAVMLLFGFVLKVYDQGFIDGMLSRNKRIRRSNRKS